jgi:hypothetical protein
MAANELLASKRMHHSALQNILEKSVRELGAIRPVDGAARVSLRHSSCNR